MIYNTHSFYTTTFSQKTPPSSKKVMEKTRSKSDENAEFLERKPFLTMRKIKTILRASLRHGKNWLFYFVHVAWVTGFALVLAYDQNLITFTYLLPIFLLISSFVSTFLFLGLERKIPQKASSKNTIKKAANEIEKKAPSQKEKNDSRKNVVGSYLRS